MANSVKAIIDRAGWRAVHSHPVYGPIVARNRREKTKVIIYLITRQFAAGRPAESGTLAPQDTG